MKPVQLVVCTPALVIALGSVNPLFAQQTHRLAPDMGSATLSSGRWLAAEPIRPTRVSFREEAGKSPLLAGFLSLYIPGAGSFYAGNSGHGYRHLLGVPVAGGLLFILGAGIGDAGVVPGYLGLATLIGNWPWSVVTAVRDANDHNRAASSVGAPAQLLDHVYLAPRLPLLRGDPSRGPGFGGRARTELRLVQVRF